MKPIRTISRAFLLAALLAEAASAQALTSITSLFVTYSTRKVMVKPAGDLKASIDSVDRELAAANRIGKMSEVRRQLAKGLSLLANRPWTDVADFTGSLLLRTDRQVVESQRPYTVRLEQLYAPSIEFTKPLSAHAFLRAPTTGVGAAARAGAVVKELGNYDGVSRDLRESPLAMEYDLRDVADGRYVLVVDVKDETRELGTATLVVEVRKGIDDVVARLEAESKKAPEALRAEILYPVDRMRNVNRGKLELRTLDVEKDFAAAELVLAAVKAKKDPFAGRTGDFKRHYALDAAGEVMPYRLYVPTKYTPAKPSALIIALHGLGGTEDAFFDSYGKKIPELAEQRNYIVAGALGYRVDGGYGWGVGTPPPDPTARRNSELSEQDVMQVLAQVKKLYKIDESRIYLMGHSMGAIGTWKIAPKFPEIWAAAAPFSGQGVPSTAEKMKGIPQFVVHGDADPTVGVGGSRSMVAALKAAGAEVVYIEVPGGNHSDVVQPNFVGMFDFFDAHKKGEKGAKAVP